MLSDQNNMLVKVKVCLKVRVALHLVPKAGWWLVYSEIKVLRAKPDKQSVI
jgi:hypothetical protein